ncbi:MAG: hypothetical protein K2X74_06540 [Acetobacteraceae bacterium]|nr:hypothetical protein [Acetobacteraceae bacterium]
MGTTGFGEEQARLGEFAADGLFEMANLYPRTTGLPMTVWVSPRGGARHDVRVKVCRVPGDRMVIEDAASVAVRPEPVLVEGELDTASLAAVSSWIRLNQDVLVAYWDGTADTAELVQRLQRV